MKTIEKIITENPFVDELVYFTKTLAINLVIKDEETADKYETLESRRESDVYIACKEGRARFDMFEYDREFLERTYLIPSYLIDDCVLDMWRIPEGLRDKITEKRVIKYLADYEEKNTYYRMLQGLPALDDKEPVYIPKEYTDGIEGLPEGMSLMPVTELDIDTLTMLYSHGVIDQVLKDHPDKKYLQFMGDNAIDVYKARKANDFQILYMPTVGSPEVMDKFLLKYDQNRMFTLKTIYSDAYKYGSEYYNNFICVLIIVQTMIDVITEVQEFIARRDIFDDRSIRFLFESYGMPYYPEIPRKYQLAMIKNMNTLVKWKASTKNMIDICSLFGFEEIQIFRYYLLKDRFLEDDGDFDKSNDTYQFHYKEIINEYGEKETVPDNDKNFALKFVRVPIEDEVDNYLKDRMNYEDYDDITFQDEYWDGQQDHEEVKSALLDKEFSWIRTKYISIDTLYDLAQLSFDLAYFQNLLVDDWIKENKVYVLIPRLKNNHRFRLNDIFVYLFSLTYAYYGLEDSIMDTAGKVFDILAFNMHADVHEIASKLFKDHYLADLHDMGADYFYIPHKEVTDIEYLLTQFRKNKEIYETVRKGMREANNKKEYDAYKYVYESFFISDLTFTFFTKPDGTQAKTYSEFLKDRDYVLYESILELQSHGDDNDAKQKAIADTIIDVVYALDEYIDSDEFRYIYAKMPAVSADYIRNYMLKIIDFFKSYKVHMLGISTVYKVFDKTENMIRPIDDFRMTDTFEYPEKVNVVEDVDWFNNSTKEDQVQLLEKVLFEIEHWDLLDKNDRVIIDTKKNIVSLIAKLLHKDSIIVTDHGKNFPFHEIIYTYDRGEQVNAIDDLGSIDVKTSISERFSPLEKIEFQYHYD